MKTLQATVTVIPIHILHTLCNITRAPLTLLRHPFPRQKTYCTSMLFHTF